MNHHTAIKVHVLWGIRHHRASKSIFHAETIFRVRDVCVDMPILIVELRVAVVRHLHDPIFDTKCIGEIRAKRMPRNLDCPASEVFSVEE